MWFPPSSYYARTLLPPSLVAACFPGPLSVLSSVAEKQALFEFSVCFEFLPISSFVFLQKDHNAR